MLKFLSKVTRRTTRTIFMLLGAAMLTVKNVFFGCYFRLWAKIEEFQLTPDINSTDHHGLCVY